MRYYRLLSHWNISILAAVLLLQPVATVGAASGDYTASAHANSGYGVKRNGMPGQYLRGNCAHCHEQHLSVDGSEPTPVDGLPSDYLLLSNPETACFACHGGTSQNEVIINNDYSATFGGAVTGAETIMAAFNQHSHHDLDDIQTFLSDTSGLDVPAGGSPCSGCHNAHMAEANKRSTAANIYTAISRPTDHGNLWGDDSPNERMSDNAYNDQYQPPYFDGSNNLEPDGLSSDRATQANKTPDYNGFCTDCHTSTASIYSTTLGRTLKKINWGIGGDKHGAQLTDGHDFQASGHIVTPRTGGGGLVQPPYVIDNDYVLSCLDCHEPHGSANVMLLRRRANGGDLNITITTMDEFTDDAIMPNDNKDIGYLCLRCHFDDKARGAFSQTEDNHWRYVHHADATGYDTPYCGGSATWPDTQLTCGGDGALRCHGWPGPGFGTPHCNDCHYHGAVVTITNGLCANEPDSTRKTF